MPKSPASKKQASRRRNGSHSCLKLDDDDHVSAMKSSSPAAFPGSGDSSMTKRPLYPIFEAASEDAMIEEEAVEEVAQHVEKKRRLSMEQVKSLEKYFELENKLEPERKLQLARELGLQPRQVAVWFQNRRARWKTKQLEKDYDLLKASLDTLKRDYSTLLQEKQKLESEVQRLNEMISSDESGGASSQLKDEHTVLFPDIKIKVEDAENLSSGSNKAEELSVDIIKSNMDTRNKSKDNCSSSDSDDSEILDEESPHHPNTRLPNAGSDNNCFSLHPDVLDMEDPLECHNLESAAVDDDAYVRLFPMQSYCHYSRPKLEDSSCFHYDCTAAASVPTSSASAAAGGFMSLEEDQDQGWWEWS